MTEVSTVRGSRRIVLGHAVMGLGLGLRRLTVPLCVLATVALAVWCVLHAATGAVDSLPGAMPFHLGAGLGLAGWLLAGGVAVAALFLALRLLAVMVGAIGWMLLPTEHRDLLSRLERPPSNGGSQDGPRPPGATLQAFEVRVSHGRVRGT